RDLPMRARKLIYVCELLALLCNVSVCLAQATVDTGTQRNRMHSCPVGQFVLAVQAARDELLCGPLPGNFAAEVVVGRDIQEQGMPACPPGMAVTGGQAHLQQLACAPLTNPPPTRSVDSTTQNMGMHACPEGTAVAGLDAGRNFLLCAFAQGTEIE